MRPSWVGPRTATAGLVGANLVPLVGVLALGWGLHSLLVVYWLESGVVGAESAAKILLAQGTDDEDGRRTGDAGGRVERSRGGPAGAGPAAGTAGRGASVTLHGRSLDSLVGLGNLLAAGFFTVHYGIFWVVHGIFVLSFPAIFADLAPASPRVVAAAFVGLAAYHAISFLANYIGEREYLGASTGVLMSEPYRRVVVLHLTILGGAFLVAIIDAPVGALVVMVVVKSVIDLRAHLAEHERARKRSAPTPAPE